MTALILAASEQPEYKEATFGVISLVGDEQAYRVEKLVRTHMSEQKAEQHDILCGNPAQFQGDERDVMFLSVVDAGGDRVLPMRSNETFKPRFNVAASRARDQMWVVHSLDPRAHLKPGDLRRQLIEYAEDPGRRSAQIAAAEAKAESEFERAVQRRFIDAGYRITPQWRVGYYRIDIVVHGAKGRVAVECDGDKFHGIEKLPEDMARQRVLERLGWRFTRIRGSQFYLNPERTMQSVFEQLHDLGVEPIGSTEEPEQRDSELRRRVIERAKEIRAEWQEERETGRRKRGAVHSVAVIPMPALESEPESKSDDEERSLQDDDAEETGTQEPGVLTSSITAQEIRGAILRALPETDPISREQLIKKAADSLGVKRVHKKFRSRLAKIITDEIRRGHIALDPKSDQLSRAKLIQAQMDELFAK